MSELSKKRVKFNVGKQTAFINSVLAKTGLTLTQLSMKLGINRRTLADWRREENLISLESFNKLIQFSKIKKPNDLKLLDKYWYTSKGGEKGYKAVIKKYGKVQVDEAKRLEAWEKWYQSKGRHVKWQYSQPKSFVKPKKSKDLAEFIGTMMGDGGITKYQITVTLHCRDDKKYGEYVTKQMFKLFKVKPSVMRRHNVHNYIISRVELVKYLQTLGLVIGNKVKQNFDIPGWIKNNHEFSKECIRGIFDTDGCLIRHKYVSNGKIYRYKKIDITSKSDKLLSSINNILNKLEIKNRISKQYSIRIEAEESVKKFFEIIGSNNPKHINKYINPII